MSEHVREKIRAPKTSWHLDRLQRLVRGEAPPPPIAALIGFRIVEADLGRAMFELAVEPRHHNPMGTLHGGVIGDVADAAIGCAMASSLEADETFTSLDLTTKFFKPVFAGRITAVARLIKRTRTLGFLECDVTDEGGSLVAAVYSSCMVLRDDAAKGRTVR
jgi:uncharacterized protein (TIGR00369 family)